MLTMILLLSPSAYAAPTSPLAAVLHGQDVVVPFGKHAKMHSIGVVADAQLDCSRCPANHGKIWIINGRPGPLDLGAGQFIDSSESWGAFTTPAGSWKDRNDPNMLLDTAIDSFPHEWVYACTLDGKGHVVVTAASDWPVHGYPAASVLRPLTSHPVTSREGRYVCLNERGILGLYAGIPQLFANDRGRLTWTRNLEPGQLNDVKRALDELPARLPPPPAGAQDAEAPDSLRARLGTVTDAMKADLARFTCECDPAPQAPLPEQEPALPDAFGPDNQINPGLLDVCRAVGARLTALKPKFAELGQKKSRQCRAFFPKWRTRGEQVRVHTSLCAPFALGSHCPSPLAEFAHLAVHRRNRRRPRRPRSSPATVASRAQVGLRETSTRSLMTTTMMMMITMTTTMTTTTTIRGISARTGARPTRARPTMTPPR